MTARPVLSAAGAAVAALTLAAGAAVAHPPALGPLPAGLTFEATSKDGATVVYTLPTATHGGTAVPVTCAPPPGATFPLGLTNVVCAAKDPDTGETAAGAFVVAVADTRGPVFSGTARRTAEATSSRGALVSYTKPDATDAVDGPRPVSCTPDAGAAFALGTTKVTCTASDTRGNSSSASFDVVVEDTRAPVFRRVPRRITRKTNGPAPVEVQYDAPSAVDVVDGDVDVTCAPAPGDEFTLGPTTVSCTAADSHGNTGVTVFVVEVVDLTPPAVVTAFAARADARTVTLTWTPPPGDDLRGVEITRVPGLEGAAPSVVYRGSARTFTDRRVVTGRSYRYVVVGFDYSGNRSKAVQTVARVARASLLLAPADGATVTGRPLLRWTPVARATYYNVQLFRGALKILSTWPTRPALRLQEQWTYQGREYRLTPGLYRWYVWPGFGPLKQARYGKVLGSSTFVIRG